MPTYIAIVSMPPMPTLQIICIHTSKTTHLDNTTDTFVSYL